MKYSEKWFFLTFFALFSGVCAGQYYKKRITIINDTMPVQRLFYSYDLTAHDLGPNPGPAIMRQLHEIPGGSLMDSQQSTYIFVTENQPEVSIYAYIDAVDLKKGSKDKPFRERRFIKTAVLPKAMFEEAVLSPGDTTYKYSDLKGNGPEGKQGLAPW